MGSELLLEWLNRDMALSQPVLSLERDFRNGYLLGEVLHLYNQQPDFCDFRNSEDSEARKNNFCRLQKTLRNLRVPFDAKMANSIMQEHKGTAAQVLYHLKMATLRLTQTTSKADASSGADLPCTREKLPKPQYEAASDTVFEDVMRRLMSKREQKSLRKRLEPFEQEQTRQLSQTRTWEREDEELETIHKQNVRAQIRDTYLQRKSQVALVDQQNVSVWEKGQKKARERRKRRRQFTEDITARRHDVQKEATSRETKNLMEYTAEFEGRLASSTALVTQNSQAPSHGSERERRRNKFITECEAAQGDEYRSRHIDTLRELMVAPCKMEKMVHEATASLLHFTQVIRDNRTFRENQYDCWRQSAAVQLAEREARFADDKIVLMQLDEGLHAHRALEAKVAREVQVLSYKEKLVRQVLDEAIEVAISTALMRSELPLDLLAEESKSGAKALPDDLWQDLTRSFVASLGPPYSVLSAVAFGQERAEGQEEDPQQKKLSDHLNECDLLDWMAGGIDHPELQDAILQLQTVAEPPPEALVPPYRYPFDLKLCMAGPAYAGKSKQAQLLAEAFNLKVISCQDELRAAAECAKRAQVKPSCSSLSVNRELLGMGRDALTHLLSGEPVPDELQARLAVAAIDRISPENASAASAYSGWVLADFPESASQVAELDRLLSGGSNAIIPSKITGIDAIIYLDASPATSSRRCLARLSNATVGDAAVLTDPDSRPTRSTWEDLTPTDDKFRPVAELPHMQYAHITLADQLVASWSGSGVLHRINTEQKTVDIVSEEAVKYVQALLDQRKAAADLLEQQATADRLEEERAAAALLLERQNHSSEDHRNLEMNKEIEEEEKDDAATASTENMEARSEDLTAELAKKLIAYWQTCELQVRLSTGAAFSDLRACREHSLNYTAQLHRGFYEVLQRPDGRQEHVEVLLSGINNMQEDMRFLSPAEAELNLLVEQCRARLWEVAEGKHRDILSLIGGIERDGWVERQVAVSDNCYVQLVQNEISMFHAAMWLLRELEAAKLGKAAEAPQEPEEPIPTKGSKTSKDKKGAQPMTEEKPQIASAPPNIAAAYLASQACFVDPIPEATLEKNTGGKSKASKRASAAPAPVIKKAPVLEARQAALQHAQLWASSIGVESALGEVLATLTDRLEQRTQALVDKAESASSEIRILGERSLARLTEAATTRMDEEVAAAECVARIVKQAISDREPMRQSIILAGTSVTVDADRLLLPEEEPLPCCRAETAECRRTRQLEKVLQGIAVPDSSGLLWVSDVRFAEAMARLAVEDEDFKDWTSPGSEELLRMHFPCEECQLEDILSSFFTAEQQ
jgi:hypothetical protein